MLDPVTTEADADRHVVKKTVSLGNVDYDALVTDEDYALAAKA